MLTCQVCKVSFLNSYFSPVISQGTGVFDDPPWEGYSCVLRESFRLQSSHGNALKATFWKSFKKKMFTVHFSEDLCRSRFSIFITLTMKILPQPQPRSVLIVQQLVSNYKLFINRNLSFKWYFLYISCPGVSYNLHAFSLFQDFQNERSTT